MIHRAGSGQAQRVDRHAPRSGQHPHRVEIGMFALRRTHAHGAEALQQLDTVKTFLRGVFEIFDLQIFVEVDEILALRMIDDSKRM